VPAPKARLKVLVVDDEAALLLTISANLELEGFDVVEAGGAERALELLRKERFDLVLSDIRMPGMNGIDLVRALRAMGADVPVVLMTAFTAESALGDAVEEGVFTIVTKPFEVTALVASLSEAARRPLVLVVDDEPSVARSAADALSAMGIRTGTAESGPRALERVLEGGIDVVVVDMVMPGVSGADVIEQIALHDRSVACIGVSGYDAPILFRRAARHTVSFLRKPVPPSELALSIALARGRVRPRLARPRAPS
jgi:CheY-like chemotaxis protein